jgi:hypothetical protein
MFDDNNNSNSFHHLLFNGREDDEIVRLTNTKEQTIPVIIYYIEKQLQFIKNEIKELKYKLELFNSNLILGSKVSFLYLK